MDIQLSDLLNIRQYKFIIDKYNRNGKFLVGLIIVVNILLRMMGIKISFNYNSIHFKIRSIINVVIIIVWFLNRYFFIFTRNYFHKKTLIVFRIVASDIVGYELLKDKFFTKMNSKLSKQYKMKLFYDDEARDSQALKKLNKKINATMIFDIEESSGEKYNEKRYEFKIKQIIYDIAFYNNKIMDSIFKDDLVNAINNYFILTKGNSIEDINNSEMILEAGIRYVISIIYLLTKKENLSYIELNHITKILDEKNLKNSKNIEYIKNHLDDRYIDYYIGFYIKEYVKSKNASKNKESLKKISIYYEDYLIRLNKIKSRISKYSYDYFLYHYYTVKAVIDFDLYGVDKSMSTVEEWYKYNFNISCLHQFDKAYLLACKDEYIESIKIYKRILKTNKMKDVNIEEIIQFIDNHINENNNNGNYFCKCIITYLWIDRKEGLKLMEKMKNVNEKVYDIITEQLGL